MTRSMILAGILIALTACADDPAPATPLEPAVGSIPATQRAALNAARAATARFQHFDEARKAGYTTLFLNSCIADERLGGMGFHYVNQELLDDRLEVTRPEAVLYELDATGRRRLVALEYVVPADAWTKTEPPRLFGRELTLNAFNLYALHVWIWKENPSGLFADWNPTVSCRHTTAAPMAH